MNTNWKSVHHLTSVLLMTVALAGCASGPKPPPPELQQQIEAAQTPSDHEAIAAYYDREAVSARATAEEHRKMAKRYEGITSIRGRSGMPGHCRSLATIYESAAVEYQALAAEHRRMGAAAKP